MSVNIFYHVMFFSWVVFLIDRPYFVERFPLLLLVYCCH